MTDSDTCQHIDCDDAAANHIGLEDGRTADLCEDHAHMTITGDPVDGYEPNDPEKFTTDDSGVPEGVLRGIIDTHDGNTASKDDLKEELDHD